MTALLLATLLLAQTADPANCPMHAKHTSQSTAKGDAHHGAEVDSRHDAFGMAHEAVRHSFRLYEYGGIIELRAIREDDASSIDAIRGHMREIAESFTRGDFEKPLHVHGRLPDGVSEMKGKQSEIEYRFEELPRGAHVRISTTDRDALSAIHRFLRFQIVEHRTGESQEVRQAGN